MINALSAAIVSSASVSTLALSLVLSLAISSPTSAVHGAQAGTNAPPTATTTTYTVDIVAKGIEHPWGLQFLPDGRKLVTERPGRLRIVDGAGKLSVPVAGLPPVVAEGQGGLLDVALAPDYATSGLLYLSFSEPHGTRKNRTAVLRARLVLTGDTGRLEDVEVIFRQQPSVDSALHFGSRIVVNTDGSLFVTLGERYTARNEAQNPANDLGKIVRIMPDGAPFAGNPGRTGRSDWAPEVWSIGHRNVQGAALDPVTGRLWTVEHGARGGDELNHPEAGRNYGWPVITYGRDYSGAKIGIGTEAEGMEQPVYFWDPSIATSGLAFYTGPFGSWQGSVFVGGLAGAHIERLVLNDGRVVAMEPMLADRGWRIRDVRIGPDGALWALTDADDGYLVKITPKPE